MSFNFKYSTMALMLSLGLTACGSSGGGSHNDTSSTEKNLLVQQNKDLEKQLVEQKNQANEATSQLEQEKTQNQNLRKQQTELEKQLADANQALNEKASTLDKLQQDHNASQEALQKAQTDLQASQSTVEKLTKQLTEFKQQYPQAELTLGGSRIKNRPEGNNRTVAENFSGLLPEGETDEQVVRNLLFTPKSVGKQQRVRYHVEQQIDGRNVQMDYNSYHYQDGESYLAELYGGGQIDGQETYPSIVAYGGKATPIEKFDAFKQAQVVKVYDMKMRPGMNTWWDSYDTKFTADFGKETISGRAVKTDLSNNFTNNDDIIFPEQPIFVKDDAIRFSSNTPNVKVTFTTEGEDTMNYEGMMIGENAEKVVGRVGGSTFIGNEQK
ncbi:hypothetical protein [Avibacterium avium]|uniref:hypothetical protein n=1 Tax=Avibacterium avium TaxID=751 RepID=UPI0039FCFB9D